MATATSPNPLLVVREEPLCAETLLAEQRGVLTGNDRFYVRSNFPHPSGWSGLRVSGAVKRPLSLGVAALNGLASRDLVVTMECAGNGRAFLDPPAEGEQWSLGAVSTALWTGVPLVEILDRAELLATVVEVVFEGGDGFARSLPIDVARDPDTLLATAMNGGPLPREHGGPLRLIVPRWYGMASVKWVEAVVALTRPFDGHFQAERYVIDGRPVREMRVRAVMAEPAAGSVVASEGVRLSGYAWSGEGGIARVEVSDDGGRTWLVAALLTPAPPYAWTRWWLDWVPPHLGDVAILARATDTAGNVQPLEPSWNRLGYCNNGAVPHQLVVAPGAKEAVRWQ
jgi:DMSO/TMAO reductase YedYZ molybdopterin-dependent catalytic subunit